MEERKIIKIGGVEFYEDEAPAVGMYIFRRTKIVKVCQRKNGTKYDKIVAVTKKLENRGCFDVHDEIFTKHKFDINIINSDPRLYNEDYFLKRREFKKFEEKFSGYFNYPTSDVFEIREKRDKFDEYKEKYPVFKMWVEGLERKRQSKFETGTEKYAVMKIWEETY